jgi:hypothetical protein
MGDADTCQRELDQFCLGIRRPDDAARPFAVAEARAIQYDNSIFSGNEIEQSTGFKILKHAPVAVQQDHWISCASFHVMEPNSIHFDKTARRWIVSLSFVCKVSI